VVSGKPTDGHHYDGIGARGRGCARHDGYSLPRLQNRNIFVDCPCSYFSDHVERGGKVRNIGSTDGISIPHGPGKGRVVAVGEHRLG